MNGGGGGGCGGGGGGGDGGTGGTGGGLGGSGGRNQRGPQSAQSSPYGQRGTPTEGMPCGPFEASPPSSHRWWCCGIRFSSRHVLRHTSAAGGAIASRSGLGGGGGLGIGGGGGNRSTCRGVGSRGVCEYKRGSGGGDVGGDVGGGMGREALRNTVNPSAQTNTTSRLDANARIDQVRPGCSGPTSSP